MNDEGGNELRGPSQVAGYTLMILRESRAGQELGKADILSLQPKDFPGRLMRPEDLRPLAYEVHDLAVQYAPQLDPPELLRRLQTRL